MELLTEKQWAELFDTCKQSAWHLEMRDSYGVHDEMGRLAEFLATGRIDEGGRRGGAPLLDRLDAGHYGRR